MAEAKLGGLRVLEVVVSVERDPEPTTVLAKEEIVYVGGRTYDGVREDVAR